MSFVFDPAKQEFTNGKRLTNNEKDMLLASEYPYLATPERDTYGYDPARKEMFALDSITLVAKYISDFETIKTDLYGNPKKSSWAAWMRRNDAHHVIASESWGDLKIDPRRAGYNHPFYLGEKPSKTETYDLKDAIIENCIKYFKSLERNWLEDNAPETILKQKLIGLVSFCGCPLGFVITEYHNYEKFGRDNLVVRRQSIDGMVEVKPAEYKKYIDLLTRYKEATVNFLNELEN